MAPLYETRGHALTLLCCLTVSACVKAAGGHVEHCMLCAMKQRDFLEAVNLQAIFCMFIGC